MKTNFVVFIIKYLAKKMFLTTSIKLCKEKTNLMHNLFLVYIVNFYMFWKYLSPSSGGTTVCIQHLVLIIIFRWLSVVLVGLELRFNPTRTTDSHPKIIISTSCYMHTVVESSWNVMTHGDAREGTWRGKWRMEWVASTLHYLGTWCIHHYYRWCANHGCQ